MRTVPLLILTSLLAAGCGHRNNIVLLERDLRLQEDEIYHLECLLDECEAARESTIRENESLKKELATGDRGPGYDSPDSGAKSTPPPKQRKRSPGPADEPKLEAPTIELPEPSGVPSVELPPASDSGATLGSGTPTQLVIDKRLTGGLDRDGRDGDEGLLVVVEPRDAAGHPVKAVGALSVALMDPSQSGEAARIARWDFAAHEVQSHFHSTVFGRGLQFELPWPGDPPKNSALRLHVRFVTESGQKLNADLPINVKPPRSTAPLDRQTKGWEPTQSADRPARTPTSRVKTPGSKPSPPRSVDRGTDTHSADSRNENEKAREPEDVPEQASRSDRPVWTPYR
jgi:hypothetical protein